MKTKDSRTNEVASEEETCGWSQHLEVTWQGNIADLADAAMSDGVDLTVDYIRDRITSSLTDRLRVSAVSPTGQSLGNGDALPPGATVTIDC